MKKALITLALFAIAVTSNAQWFDLTENHSRYNLGFQLGAAGFGTQYSDFGVGVSLSVWGVYLDFLIAPPDHQTDNHVTNTLWEDDEAFVINAGYQIPVLPWLRVAPIIGYSQTNYGYTDASTVNIHVDNENSGHISHDYIVVEESRRHEVNFGAGIFVDPIEWLSIYAVATRRAIYGGIGFNLSLLE